MNTTPRSQRLHIALFGRRNVGKSSLINALTNQEVAIVADVPGTTTDPVTKAMEVLPLGPVLFTDTAGLDDTGDLGALRVQKSLDVLQKTDLVLLVTDPTVGVGDDEQQVVARARKRDLPVLGIINKIDLHPEAAESTASPWAAAAPPVTWTTVSALTRQGIDQLKRLIVQQAPKDWTLPTIVGDLIAPGDSVILVIPIDKAAPKGRLILPQQQVIRDLLEHDALAVMVKERELRHVFNGMVTRPRLVITDASAYLKAIADTPPAVPLTSFSILFARYKGDLNTLAVGAGAVNKLRPGDRVLIAEACTHHPIADDIGRVKIPRWLRQTVGGDLHFEVRGGSGPLPDDLRDYQLVVHCGACMLNRREMLYRLLQAREAEVPIVNYGVLMAHMHGVLPRVLSPFPAALNALEAETPADDPDLALLRSMARRPRRAKTEE